MKNHITSCIKKEERKKDIKKTKREIEVGTWEV